MDLMDLIFGAGGIVFGAVLAFLLQRFGVFGLGGGVSGSGKSSSREVKALQIANQVLEDENKLLKSKIDTLERAVEIATRR